jgi:hypothetical protein
MTFPIANLQPSDIRLMTKECERLAASNQSPEHRHE